MQEEERELRDNYCPEVSEVKTEGIEIDKVTYEMLKSIGMEKIPGINYRRPNDNRNQRNNRRQFRGKPKPRRQ